MPRGHYIASIMISVAVAALCSMLTLYPSEQIPATGEVVLRNLILLLIKEKINKRNDIKVLQMRSEAAARRRAREILWCQKQWRTRSKMVFRCSLEPGHGMWQRTELEVLLSFMRFLETSTLRYPHPPAASGSCKQPCCFLYRLYWQQKM
jgi:hypothetical protein